MNKENISFNVIIYDVNKDEFVPYDIMPYLVRRYNDTKKKDRPVTFEEFKKFVDSSMRYQYWARCEYEIILSDWPCQKKYKKIDVYEQFKMNIDLIVKLLMDNMIKNNK